MNINNNDADKLIQNVESIALKLDVLPDMRDKLHDIDIKTAVVCNQVKTNKEEIDRLRKRGNVADGLLAAFTLAMTYVGTVIGGNR